MSTFESVIASASWCAELPAQVQHVLGELPPALLTGCESDLALDRSNNGALNGQLLCRVKPNCFN